MAWEGRQMSAEAKSAAESPLAKSDTNHLTLFNPARKTANEIN
jgi:hypothetical protein